MNGHTVEGSAIIAGNETGHGDGIDCVVRFISFDYENHMISFTVKFKDGQEGMGYLDECETMKLSQSLRALAIKALEGL